MCGASDARIQSFGRWLNPDSIKIYARISAQEYMLWIDRMMRVQRIDTARTTNLPTMDLADALLPHAKEVHADSPEWLASWDRSPAPQTVAPSPLKPGERVSIFWTEMDEWFDGTFRTSRIEPADGGGRQRSSCILYDAVGQWAQCNRSQLTYWHCLDDEQWKYAETTNESQPTRPPAQA